MADRNNNGVPDDKERKGRSSGNRKATSFGGPLKPSLGNSPDPLTGLSNWAKGNRGYMGRGETYKPTERFGGLFGNIANTANDITRNLGNFWGSEILGERSPRGGGRGDAMVGSNPVDRIGAPTRRRGGVIPKTGGLGAMPEEPEMSLADYLAMANQLIGGGGPGVNYDPQREALRGRASENDARLEAMYRQLRGSIDADAPKIQEAYQTAIDSGRQNTTDAQAQIQAATDAANSRNNEVLANLGIQEAAGNSIQEGTDLNSQAARQISDMAARGQASGDRLVSNQATALQHNTNIGNAAGLEGNLQRASNQARLQALLAEIDMQEQQENASAQQNAFSQQLGLANQLLDFDRYNQERQDNLQMSAAELAAKQQSQYDPNAFWQYIKGLGGVDGLAPLSDDPNTQIRQLDLYRKIFAG